MARKKAPEKISREAYNKILHGLELLDIYLQSCSCNLKVANLSLVKGLSAEVKDKATYEVQDDSITVTHTFNLMGKQEGAKDYLFKISAAFDVLYKSTEPFNNDFFEVFKRTSLVLNTWPFFREFAQSLTQRMGIPPVTLPLVKTA